MMVTRWGFSPELGTVAYGDNNDEVFLGMSMGRQQTVSESTAQKIDAEVRRLVETGLEEARRILGERKDDLEALAQGLLEYETLSGDEIKNLLKGRPPVRDGGDVPADPGPRRLGALRRPRPAEGERRRPGAAAAGLRAAATDEREGRHDGALFRMSGIPDGQARTTLCFPFPRAGAREGCSVDSL